ncbi:hypothetical protein PENNAL_c0013G08374 [Penicillium nalgiovense]|uniref:Uncharacterized protein n=1 Tax=Penicillium nalgiovense TaxID=60175 RepID=A0A1V6YR53_PENNA|nr:hypothetical protein PENNAL_c0013G08374 [Penicillium nalgiovense]
MAYQAKIPISGSSARMLIFHGFYLTLTSDGLQALRYVADHQISSTHVKNTNRLVQYTSQYTISSGAVVVRRRAVSDRDSSLKFSIFVEKVLYFTHLVLEVPPWAAYLGPIGNPPSDLSSQVRRSVSFRRPGSIDNDAFSDRA